MEAPVAGSMILAGVLLKLGGYGLLRLMPCFPRFSRICREFIVRVSLWGAVLARLVCLRQTDIKALVAYSSVAHMGLLLAGVFSFRR